MRTLKRDAAAGFSGGLDLTADALSLPQDRLRWAENLRLTQRGAIQKRGGSKRIHVAALPAAIQSVFTWSQPGNVQMLAVANGTLYKTTVQAAVHTWTSVSSGLSATSKPSFAIFRDASGVEVVYIADGVTLRKFNGTTLSAVSGAPANVAVLRVYNQRLLAITGLDERLYFSALNNGDTLGDAGNFGGFGVVRTFGDQEIASLGVLGERLLLFHVSGISSFTGLGQDDIAIQAGTQGITSDVGTIAALSVVEAEQAVFFLSDRGFYKISPAGLEPIGERILPLFDGLGPTALKLASGVHDRTFRTINWAVPGVGAVSYDYRLNAWTGPFTGGMLTVATTALAEGVFVTGSPVVLRGDALGYVSRMDVPGIYRDNVLSDGSGGERYGMKATLRRFYHDDLAMEKLYRRAYVVADIRADPSPTVGWITQTQAGRRAISGDTLGLITAYDSPNVAYDDPSYGYDAGGVNTFAVPLGGRGLSVDIDIDDIGEGATVISAVTVEATLMGIRPLYRSGPPPVVAQPPLPVFRLQLAVEIGGSVDVPVLDATVALLISTQPG